MTQKSGSSKVRHVCIRSEIANMPKTIRICWKIFLFFIESFLLKKAQTISHEQLIMYSNYLLYKPTSVAEHVTIFLISPFYMV